jgi:hypothetical protein
MPLLDGLDRVRWAKLRHAYGSAEDVPHQLRAIAENTRRMDEAVEALFSNIFHQGTVYQATTHAVPFLIELAREPKVKKRVDVRAMTSLVLVRFPARGDELAPLLEAAARRERPGVYRAGMVALLGRLGHVSSLGFIAKAGGAWTRPSGPASDL